MQSKRAIGVAVCALLALAAGMMGCARNEAQPPGTTQKDMKTMTETARFPVTSFGALAN
jgi:hypothetical protein